MLYAKIEEQVANLAQLKWLSTFDNSAGLM